MRRSLLCQAIMFSAVAYGADRDEYRDICVRHGPTSGTKVLDGIEVYFECDKTIADGSDYDTTTPPTPTADECARLCSADADCESFSWLYGTEKCLLSNVDIPKGTETRWALWAKPKGRTTGPDDCDDKLRECELDRNTKEGDLADCNDDLDDCRRDKDQFELERDQCLADKQQCEDDKKTCEDQLSAITPGGGSGGGCPLGSWQDHTINGNTYRTGCGFVSLPLPARDNSLGYTAAPWDCMWLCARNKDCKYAVFHSHGCSYAFEERKLPVDQKNPTTYQSGTWLIGPGSGGVGPDTKLPTGSALWDWCPRITNSRVTVGDVRFLYTCNTNNRPPAGKELAKFAADDLDECAAKCAADTQCIQASWSSERTAGETCLLGKAGIAWVSTTEKAIFVKVLTRNLPV